MVDDEKRENLANARRKLKKFRDQQQPNSTETNDNNVHMIDVPSLESIIPHNPVPQNGASFAGEQQTTPNGLHPNLSKSPVVGLEERTRLENQRPSSGASNVVSRHSSQTSIDSEKKLRRDVEHLQEQLEVHVQTIGILVAEKTDVSAKLSQSFKQLERKQSEMDELYGRLKASRERVQELEKQIQNSTSNVQKREMAAKESDKENDRLKIENIRQSQLIEDLKQNINEFKDKLQNRQNHIDQLQTELEQSKIQSQPMNETATTEQQTKELQHTITLQNIQIEELQSSINRIRSDNEQYQQYNTQMQHHIQELNDQINQLIQTNHMLENKQDDIKLSEHENLQQENQLFRNAIDQWSSRYEELRVKLEQMTKLSTEKDERIGQLEIIVNHSTDSRDQNQSDEILNLRNHIQSVEQLNQQLNERLEKSQVKLNHEEETQTEDQQIPLPLSSDGNHENESQEQLMERLNETIRENTDLKDRAQQLEHVILQLQSETDTIGDYIRLYQQQREQLQKRYQEKDDYIQQLTQDRFNLQKKLSELEILLFHGLNMSQLQEVNTELVKRQDQTKPSSQSELNTEEQLETIDNLSSTVEQTTPLNIAQTTPSITLPQLTDETKARILTLIRELGQNNISSLSNDNLSTIKLAFVDKNFYICSTCSGPVQWV